MDIMEEKKKIVLKESDFINNQISFFAISKYLNQIAISHATNLGVGYDVLLKQNLYWVLSKLKIDILEKVNVGETLILTTWPHENPRVSCYREYAFYNKDDKVVIKAISVWLTIDIHTYHIYPAKNIVFPGIYKKDSNYDDIKNAFDKIEINEASNRLGTYQIKDIDIDDNKHTNNTRYILMSENYFKNNTYSSLQIDFINQSFKEDIIYIYNVDDIFYGMINDKVIYKMKIK